MNKQEFLNESQKLLDQIITTIEKKNNDYSGGDSNPFSNFKLGADLGFTPSMEHGLMLRVTDKLQRIRSYLQKGELAVPNESIYDAISDTIGYMLILNAMIKDKDIPF